jgi:hypothetical protein
MVDAYGLSGSQREGFVDKIIAFGARQGDKSLPPVG